MIKLSLMPNDGLVRELTVLERSRPNLRPMKLWVFSALGKGRSWENLIVWLRSFIWGNRQSVLEGWPKTVDRMIAQNEIHQWLPCSPSQTIKTNSFWNQCFMRWWASQWSSHEGGVRRRLGKEGRKILSFKPPTKASSCISLKQQIWLLAKSELQCPSKTKQSNRGHNTFENFGNNHKRAGKHCALGIHLLSSRTSSPHSTPIQLSDCMLRVKSRVIQKEKVKMKSKKSWALFLPTMEDVVGETGKLFWFLMPFQESKSGLN